MRSIKAASKDPKFSVDQFMNKVVHKNSPERLKAVLNAVDNPQEVRSRLAHYLDDAMARTGVDLMNPNQFNGQAFRNQIRALAAQAKNCSVLSGVRCSALQIQLLKLNLFVY